MKNESRILVIDDDEGTRKMLSLIFEKKGYNCTTAGSGKEAIQAAHDVPFNIALIDIRLPDMEGIELLATFTEAHPDMDSIIITGFASIDNAIQALNMGAAAYITKPLDMDNVLHEVEHVIERQYFASEKRLAYEHINHLNAILRGIRNVNQLITQVSDREELIQGACRNLTETLGYVLAWIIIRDEHGSPVMVKSSGFKDAGVALKNHIMDNGEVICDKKAQETSELVVVLDPSHECEGCSLVSEYTHGSALCKRLEYEGKIYGTISVVLPGEFITDEEEQSLFSELAGDIAFALYKIELEEERERNIEEINALYYRQSALLAAVPDILMEVDENKVYIWANNAGFEFFGDDVLGNTADHYFVGEQETYDIIQPIFNGHEDFIYVESLQRRKDGEERLLAWWCRGLNDSKGHVTGALSTARDITDQKNFTERLETSLREKEILLREIHHRVKNNLQIISSLLDLQSDMVGDKKLQDLLLVSQNRIKSMALVHETLYGSSDMSNIEGLHYVESIVDYLSSIHGTTGRNVTFELDIEEIQLDIDLAIPFGLILNELISNAMKYAFPSQDSGIITIQLKRTGTGDLTLVIRDDGIGMAREIDIANVKTLGLQLVKMLVDQVRGTIDMTVENGTQFDITFPAKVS